MIQRTPQLLIQIICWPPNYYYAISNTGTMIMILMTWCVVALKHTTTGLLLISKECFKGQEIKGCSSTVMGKVKVYVVFVKVRVNGHRKLKSIRRERDLLFPWEKTGKNPSNSISCSSRSDLPMSVQMRDELRGPFHVKHTITLCFNINILFQGKKRTAIMEKCAEEE